MKAHRNPLWMKAVAWGLTALLACAAGAPPAAASEPAPPPAAAPAKATLMAAALAKVAATESRTIATQQTGAPRGSEEARSFFGSARGRIALVLLAAGIGWTIYSNSHDRIKSPIR